MNKTRHRLMKFCNAKMIYAQYSTFKSTLVQSDCVSLEILSQALEKPIKDVEVLVAKYPKICSYSEERLMCTLNMCENFSIDKDMLFDNPKLFGLKSQSIQHHAEVLLESGFKTINVSSIMTFHNLVEKKTIAQLKSKRLIPENLNVQDNLLGHLKSWPTSPAMSKRNCHNMTLTATRMKILGRYLELNIDMSQEEFENKLKTYSRIKHRPFKRIDELLDIFENKFGLIDNLMRTNFGIFLSDPQNILMMLENIPYIAGLSLRDFVMKRPTILISKWLSVKSVQDLLNESGISLEAQRTCPNIFALSAETIKRRLEEIKQTPNYSAFIHHPKLIKLIYSKNIADIRLKHLKDNHKHCATINVLSGCTEHYNSFALSTGDTNRGKDAKKIIKSLLENKYSYEEITSAFEDGCLKIIPLENLYIVHKNMKNTFSTEEIFQNCHILLFNWEKVNIYLEPLMKLKFGEKTKESSNSFMKLFGSLSFKHLDFNKISMSAILSLVLYFIDKENNFSNRKKTKAN